MEVGEFILGQPSTDHVRVTIAGRKYPDCTDQWDGNWLNGTISVRAGAWQGSYQADLRADEFPPFLEALSKMYESLSGEAEFTPMEPWLLIRCWAESGGHIHVSGEACDEIGIGNTLHFKCEIDQTFLPPVIEALKNIVNKYPVVGDAKS